VDDARNQIAQAALDQKCDFIFFLDWDVIPHPQMLHQLVMRALNAPDYDVFSGVYCCRHRDYPAPLVYVGPDFHVSYDWTVGDVLTSRENEVTGFGMGCCLIRCSLLQRIEAPWFQTRIQVEGGGETEDLYFLKLAAAAGAGLMIDTSLLCWHIDPDTGVASNLPYDSLPIKRWRASNKNIPANALPYDMGAVAVASIGSKVSNCSEVPDVLRQ